MISIFLIVTLAAAPEEETPPIPRPGEKAEKAEKPAAEEKPAEPVAAKVKEKEKPAKPGEAKPAAPKKPEPRLPEESPVPPPSLQQSALAQELRKVAREQKAARSKIDDEKKSLEEERAKLEALKKEIDESRAALREETARLEGLLPQPGSTPAPLPKAPGSKAPSNAAQVKTLAKTLKGMKAEHAAIVIGRLDRNLAAQILREMKPVDAGAVLEKLKPELAAELVSTLATTPVPAKDVL